MEGHGDAGLLEVFLEHFCLFFPSGGFVIDLGWRVELLIIILQVRMVICLILLYFPGGEVLLFWVLPWEAIPFWVTIFWGVIIFWSPFWAVWGAFETYYSKDKDY